MIRAEYFWFIVLVLSLGTISIRYSIIAMSSRLVVTARTKQIFSLIPAAILPAIIAPAVFFHHGAAAWADGKERVLVAILAVAVCHYTRSTLATIAFGLLLLYFGGLATGVRGESTPGSTTRCGKIEKPSDGLANT